MFLSPVLAVAAAVQAPATVAPEAAAGEWVALVDGAKWADSWTAAGALFQGQVTSDQWTKAIQPVRTPLGAVSSRKLEKVTTTKSLPGLPEGDYRVVEYRTDFAAKAGAGETLLLVSEGGRWKVNAYFIR
ncbi:hypothetical protein GCM10022280_06910 [Sphingomonas swuensis]|uniref:DUF4019 domain-containing protein n=1 Tax=Sphingomonas swuensis TaxID=977800 RepID=A0ABP7SHT5_9SPHN